jgi:type 1 glutamine amidotransferase/nicotinamidase-related amidase
MSAAAAHGGQTLALLARHRPADANTPVAFRSLQWQAGQTAVIVCDMWDRHWCKSASARVAELALRIDAFCKAARDAGAIVVHAPSACMKHYASDPARLRMTSVRHTGVLPDGMSQWCRTLPDEPALPIDAGDGGGCPDEPRCAGGQPWTRQIATIAIDEQRDYIGDEGNAFWALFETRGIRNVILVGVHANMCVLGRPFGLRQWARLGRNVVLVRDLTDTMYSPSRPPHVSHFRGTDLLVNHVERYVCPTITSDALLGGGPFHFKDDTRRDLLIVSAEDEYETARTLPDFAERHLGGDFRIHLALGDPRRRTTIPGIEQLGFADVAIFAIRRWPLPAGEMAAVRKFIGAGKPLVALRTASHAFAARTGQATDGLRQWPEFDREVLGVHYTGHYGNKKAGGPATLVWVEPKRKDHPVVAGIPGERIKVPSWLYKSSPVSDGTAVLMSGVLEGGPDVQPVTVARTTAAGGRVVYTSLGHPDDFKLPWFNRMLVQSVRWACEKSTTQSAPAPAVLK